MDLIEIALWTLVAATAAAVLLSGGLSFQAVIKTWNVNDDWEKRKGLLLELTVIFLIGFEIALSSLSMHESTKEADRQARTLDLLNQNMKATGDSIKGVEANTHTQTEFLNTLTKSQDDTLTALKTSVTTMQAVSKTLQSQLTIIQEDQTQRRREATKKPHLVLRMNGQALSGNIPYLDSKNGTQDFPFRLENDGDARLTHGVVSIATDPPLVLQCECKTDSWRNYVSADAVTDPETIVLIDSLGAHQSMPLNLHSRTPMDNYLRFYVNGHSDQVPDRVSIAVFTLRGAKP